MTEPTQEQTERAYAILGANDEDRWRAVAIARALAAERDAGWNEAMDALLPKIPGGQICDPQDIADMVRALKRPVTP